MAYEMYREAFHFITDTKEPPEKWRELVTSHKGFYEHSEKEWAKIIKTRDKEFLQRLKCLYWFRKD